jgi:hypothetical protein
MAHKEGENRPWTEEQWEKMMRESDLRAARFGELLETLMDHPNRDVVVAREMGWEELADALEQNPHTEDEKIGPDMPMADELDEDAAVGNDVDDLDIEAAHEAENRREGLHLIPAFVVCERAAHAVMDALKPFDTTKARRNMDEPTQEFLGEAFIGIQISCAKISGGHAMGYEDDVLCGNIVNNKRALEGARQSVRAFEALKAKKALPDEMVDKLMPMLKEAEAAIEARIEELRAKVWW